MIIIKIIQERLKLANLKLKRVLNMPLSKIMNLVLKMSEEDIKLFNIRRSNPVFFLFEVIEVCLK